jgi:hypothetical protein
MVEDQAHKERGSATSCEPGNPAPQRPRRAWLRRLLPWLSLAYGIVSAFTMDRGPKRAWVVAVIALAVWFVLLLKRTLMHFDPVALGPIKARLLRLGRQSSLTATQSAVQLMLIFSWPFYLRAAQIRDPRHAGFLVLLLALSSASLWDPLSEYLLARPRLGPLLPATGSFVALSAVLPGLGLSTQHSAWVAACVAGSGAALMLVTSKPSGERVRALPMALLLAAALPLSLFLGLGRIVPAAPLRLAAIEMGAHIENHWITEPLKDDDPAPSLLYCATAIWSPIGVRDRLWHVWQKDGDPRARIELEIRGGRGEGFRTFSRISSGRNPEGRYRCTIETGSGQVLGSKTIRLGGEKPTRKK